MIYDLSKDFLKSHFCSLYNFLSDQLCCVNSLNEKYKIIKALIECKIALAILYSKIECLDNIDNLFSKMKELGKNVSGSSEEITRLEEIYKKIVINNGTIAR